MTRQSLGLAPGDSSFSRLRAAGALVALLAMTALPAAAQSSPGSENRVVLRVNDRITTLYDYQRAVDGQIDQFRRAVGLTDRERQELVADAGRIVMKALFEELLILSRADQLAIVIEESDIEQQITATRERSGIESDEQFRQVLAQQGMREEDLRERMRVQLRTNVVFGREVAPRIELEDEDLRRFYRENEDRFRVPQQGRFEEVVILETVVPEDRLAPLATLAHTRMVAGAAASEVEEGLGDGVTAVDIGWVKPGDLAPALDAVVWDLEVGGVAEPTVARGGLHVLKMLERTPATIQPFEEVREAIERQERGRLFDEERDVYLTELAEAAYIVERLPESAEGYRPVEAPSLDDDALGLLAPFGPGAQEPEADESPSENGEAGEEADGRP